MKNQFRQSHKHGRFYVLCFLVVLTVFSSIISHNISILVFLGVLMPLCRPYFLTYRIQETGILTGGCSISVKSIRKMVYQKDRIDVYFEEGSKKGLTLKAFFPAEKQEFVHALVSINPAIQVV